MPIKEDDETYWRTAMSRRMSQDEEVTRLCTVLRGFFTNNDDGFTDIVEFWERAKRPYGAKNVAHSIAFNLGWDWQRRLCTKPMPTWADDEAMSLHAMLGEHLKTTEACHHGAMLNRG
jgi:hypothetical protein